MLLPLRAYLGVAFLYAGLSKIGSDTFFNKTAPGSMYSTLVAVKANSPIGALLAPVAHHPTAFGLLMALGETAVGIGLLLGLFARVAAGAGMLIALSLFLTVSWSARPWYTGADIVYLFALTPILLGGAGPLSADAWLAAAASWVRGAEISDSRRQVLLGGLAGLGGVLAVGVAALFRGAPSSQAARGTSTGSASTSSGSKSRGASIVAASAVPVGGAKLAKDPASGDQIYVLQLQADSFTALDDPLPAPGLRGQLRVQGRWLPMSLSQLDFRRDRQGHPGAGNVRADQGASAQVRQRHRPRLAGREVTAWRVPRPREYGDEPARPIQGQKEP